jgi:hypothetical protein
MTCQMCHRDECYWDMVEISFDVTGYKGRVYTLEKLVCKKCQRNTLGWKV